MSSDAVLLIVFGLLAVPAAGVMYGMFRGDPSAQFEVSRLTGTSSACGQRQQAA
jgi:hypothetical protein